MSPMELGIIVAIVLILVLLSGAPVAFSLGIVAVGFLLIFEGIAEGQTTDSRCSSFPFYFATSGSSFLYYLSLPFREHA